MDEMYLDQEEIDEMICDLIHQVQNSGKKFSCVVGIANGGLHISIPVAAALGLKHKSVYISYYEKKHKREKPIVRGSFLGSNCLVIDDLTDTGKTLDSFRERFGSNHDFAVLFWDTKTQKPEFYVKEKPPNWIVFPWEIEK
jgi:hypoxanthine phosphoribosyltransferase